MSIHSFTFQKPEVLLFPNKSVVKFEILGFSEHTDSPGITLKTKVVGCDDKPDYLGKEVSFSFPFITKKGKQNPAAYYFMLAMFPDHLNKGIQPPYHMLTGSFFKATSKVTEFDGKQYQNWENYVSLGHPGDENSY